MPSRFDTNLGRSSLPRSKKERIFMSDNFYGNWRISEMELWGQGFVDAEVPGYFHFSGKGMGEFQSGYVPWLYGLSILQAKGKGCRRIYLGRLTMKWTRLREEALFQLKMEFYMGI
jgi:hypothetical protein